MRTPTRAGREGGNLGIDRNHKHRASPHGAHHKRGFGRCYDPAALWRVVLRRDLTAALLAETGGLGAHVVMESSGVAQAPAAGLSGTRRGGTILLLGLQAAPREIDLFAMTVREVTIATTQAHVCGTDLPEALRVLAEWPLADIVLDRVIPLADVVEKGLRPLAEGAARGKIVVDPGAG